MKQSLEMIKESAVLASEELVAKAKLNEKDILVVGCSTSEVTGNTIGTESSVEAAGAVFEFAGALLELLGLDAQRVLGSVYYAN